MNVYPFPPNDQRGLAGSGGNGPDDRSRLRNVELDVCEIKTEMKHVARREDVLGLKIWILVGVITGMIVAITFGLGIARLFFGPVSQRTPVPAAQVESSVPD